MSSLESGTKPSLNPGTHAAVLQAPLELQRPLPFPERIPRPKAGASNLRLHVGGFSCIDPVVHASVASVKNWIEARQGLGIRTYLSRGLQEL